MHGCRETIGSVLTEKGSEVGMRLIDAYALQDAIQKSKMENPHKDPRAIANHDFEHDHFMRMVVLQPTVMKEIVRCKDCKYANRLTPYSNVYECASPNAQDKMFFQFHASDWFCADGEKGDG